jgi:hypothetical protein
MKTNHNMAILMVHFGQTRSVKATSDWQMGGKFSRSLESHVGQKIRLRGGDLDDSIPGDAAARIVVDDHFVEHRRQ